MSLNSLKSELVYLIRNEDILSTTERSVTTATTDLIAITNATTYTLNVPNVKNIRLLKVGSSTLTYGTDYTLDIDFLETTKKCKITFNVAQTGNLQITYDYGSDRIFTDFPRGDISLASYPRISIEEISKSNEPLSLGGTDFISSRMITIVIYAESQEYIEEKIELIESLIKTNAKTLYYANYIHPTGRGPLIKHMARNQIIMQKNVDCLARWEVN